MAYFIKNIQRGDPWKILKKTKKKFFLIPPKILHNTHMRSHKKFRAKKMIFRGAFGGGLSERKKIQSGVWCLGQELVACINTGHKECYRYIILVLSPMCSIMFHNKAEGVSYSYCCVVHLSRHSPELLLTTSLRVRWPGWQLGRGEGEEGGHC